MASSPPVLSSIALRVDRSRDSLATLPSSKSFGISSDHATSRVLPNN